MGSHPAQDVDECQSFLNHAREDTSLPITMSPSQKTKMKAL
jgi:hypothetical protein